MPPVGPNVGKMAGLLQKLAAQQANPPVAAAAKNLINPPQQYMGGLSGGQQANQGVASNPGEEVSYSNQRFRSFAERYLLERCHEWKPEEVEERAWETILQARTLYKKIKEVGRTIGPDT